MAGCGKMRQREATAQATGSPRGEFRPENAQRLVVDA